MSDPTLLNRFSHEAMTTIFEVVVAGRDEAYSGQASRAVFREIDRLEGLLSRFDACSDISQINRLKPGQSVRIAPDVFECLSVAAWVFAESDGAFDPTIGPLMYFKDDPRERTDAARAHEQEAARKRVGMRRLELDDSDYSVGLRPDADGGVEIDLGAIGKGYALDKAADILEEWDVEDFLLNAGFSTALAAGDGDGKGGWVVGVGGQWGKPAGIESIRLVNESLSGSGMEVKGEHIVDPATGFPAKEHFAAWSVCSSATVADALSTAFMVMLTEKVKDFCSTHDDIGAFVVEENGRLIRIGKRGEMRK